MNCNRHPTDESGIEQYCYHYFERDTLLEKSYFEQLKINIFLK